MEVVTFIAIILIIIIIVKSKTQKDSKLKESNINLSLKETVKNTFPKYKIIEKNQTIMICEITHRNEPDELVFIRITPNKVKKIRKSGRMIICDYPKIPSSSEMKKDFGKYI